MLLPLVVAAWCSCRPNSVLAAAVCASSLATAIHDKLGQACEWSILETILAL